MAYDKKILYDNAIKSIKNNTLYFIEDVIAFMPCDKTTFYRLFPTESNEYNNIKNELETNRVNTKVGMRKKWNDSDNPTLQVALMKLIATESEAHRLNGTKQEHKLSGDVNIKPKEWIK